MENIDFYVKNATSFILLIPESKRAEQWVKENIKLESWQNSFSIEIEPRFFETIYQGLISNGFTIERS